MPSLIGDRWEIDEETYREFLEVLPPLAYRGNSFYLSEFSFGDITTKYTREGNSYYCEFARWPERRWAIHYQDREFAREHGDPVLGIVAAASKAEAEDLARKDAEIVRRACRWRRSGPSR